MDENKNESNLPPQIPVIPPPIKQPEKTEINRGSLVVGVILIIAGALLFAGQALGFLNWGALWPLIIVGVGVAFFIGMVLGGKSTGALAIPGSIICMIGLILLFQSIFGLWEAWSYAWALIICAVGIGLVIYGSWSDIPDLRQKGWEVARVGLILFLIFGAIFGFIFTMTGVSGESGRLFWSFALIAVGVYLLVTRVARMVWSKERVRGDDRDLFWPVIFIGAGILAALVSLGWLGAPQWSAILSLWPLLIIFAGLQLIFGRRSAWLSAILAVLLLAAVFAFGFAGDRLGSKGLTTCSFIPGFNTSFGWTPGQTVKGSGTVIQENRPVSGITKVNFQSFGKLEISQGSSESLVVEADDNLLSYIQTDVIGGELVIGLKKGYNLRPSQTPRYILTVVDLTTFRLSGAGDVIGSGLKTDTLNINSSGAGKFQFENLQVERLNLSISGAGSVDASGQAKRLEVKISGAGSFKGGDLASEKGDVNISGAGSAEVWVTESLDASISGLGSISYYGNPSLDKQVSGLGTIKSLGNK